MSTKQSKDPEKSRKKTKNPKYDPRVWDTSDSNKSSHVPKPSNVVVDQNPDSGKQPALTAVQPPAGHQEMPGGAPETTQRAVGTGSGSKKDLRGGDLESTGTANPLPPPPASGGNGGLSPGRTANGVDLEIDPSVAEPALVHDIEPQDQEIHYEPSSPKDGHSPNTFANLFKDATTIRRTGKLRFITPVYTEIGTKHANIPDDLIIKQSEKWLLTLVGCFVGKRPAFQFVSFHAFRLWKKYGLVDVVLNNQGLFYFKFDNADGLQFVHDNRPWLFNDIPVPLRKWEVGIENEKVRHTSVSMWVNIYDLTASMWDYEILSHITSVIGIPIALDRFTEEMIDKKSGRALFARVLIKVNADQDFPACVEAVVLGKMMKFRLQYYWKPDRCSHCSAFGHKFIECADRPKPAEEMEATSTTKVDPAPDVLANDDGAQGFQVPRRRKRRAKKGFPITSSKPQFQYVPKVTLPGKGKNTADPQSPDTGIPDTTTWVAQRGVGATLSPNVETRLLDGLNTEIGTSSYIPHDDKGRDDSEDEVYDEDNPTARFMEADR